MLPAGRRHSSGLDGLTNTVINCECDPPPPSCALATRGQPRPRVLPTLFLLMTPNANSQPGAETAIQTAWFLQYPKCDPLFCYYASGKKQNTKLSGKSHCIGLPCLPLSAAMAPSGHLSSHGCSSWGAENTMSSPGTRAGSSCPPGTHPQALPHSLDDPHLSKPLQPKNVLNQPLIN